MRLTKQDMIQILGPADGIRLHNSLQARLYLDCSQSSFSRSLKKLPTYLDATGGFPAK